jgi:hypothetical protein
MSDTPSAKELRALLITLLAGATGEPETRWGPLIGEVEKRSLAFGVASNWDVVITGTEAERETIATAVALVRVERPYVHG